MLIFIFILTERIYVSIAVFFSASVSFDDNTIVVVEHSALWNALVSSRV